MSVTLEKASHAIPQLGEFDQNILCKDCDHKLGFYDDYAIEICHKFDHIHRKLPTRAFQIDNFDGDRFSKFVLSVLWRASISKRPSFSDIRLGPYELQARDVLFGNLPLGELAAFEVFVQRFDSNHLDLTGIYSLPVRGPMGNLNLNAYAFMLAGFRVVAKLDKRPLDKKFQALKVNGSNTLTGLFIEFEKTREWERLKEIARRHL